MSQGCPNNQCKFYQNSSEVIPDGKYYRKSDSRWVKRFRCRKCNKRFSQATNSLEFGQNKRRLNYQILLQLSSGSSQRRIAINLKINRKTVHRKVIYLAKKARLKNQSFLLSLRKNPIEHMHFDDLITIEHTKLKPLTVSTAVDADTRKILGVQVSQIAAFGKIAKISRKKYGARHSKHKEGLTRLFEQIKDCLKTNATIRSDEHHLYPQMVQKYFPQSKYTRHKSERACIIGQGELKKVGHDPLFYINHNYAMFRANINRLFRRSWCTTKDPHRLQDHLDIFTYWFNHIYLNATTKNSRESK